MDDEQNTTQSSADDDQDDLPQTPHTPTVPDGTVQTGQPIPDWLDNVPSNPGSVARTGLTVTETGMLHTPVTPGTKTRYGESDQDQHTTHEGEIDHGLDDSTIRQIAKAFGPSVRTPTDSQEGPNIIKPDHLNPEKLSSELLALASGWRHSSHISSSILGHALRRPSLWPCSFPRRPRRCEVSVSLLIDDGLVHRQSVGWLVPSPEKDSPRRCCNGRKTPVSVDHACFGDDICRPTGLAGSFSGESF